MNSRISSVLSQYLARRNFVGNSQRERTSSMPSNSSDPGDRRGADVDQISDERLIKLFSRPRSPKELIAGMRVLGFTADSVQLMTRAKSRDVVYSWAAGRAKPGQEQARRLDEIRHALLLICSHEELGADTAWMLFNARFASMNGSGPTAMDLIGQGEAATVIEHLETLIRDDRGGGDPLAEAAPTPDPSPATAGSS
jgi:hypothetical protein